MCVLCALLMVARNNDAQRVIYLKADSFVSRKMTII